RVLLGPRLIEVRERRAIGSARPKARAADVAAAPPHTGQIRLAVGHARDRSRRGLLAARGALRGRCGAVLRGRRGERKGHDARQGGGAEPRQREIPHDSSHHVKFPLGAPRQRAPLPSCGPNMPYFVPSAVISSRSIPECFDSSRARKPLIVTTSPCLMTPGEEPVRSIPLGVPASNDQRTSSPLSSSTSRKTHECGFASRTWTIVPVMEIGSFMS